jgi:two-component system, chemotaxis family, sensor kinase CheA
MEEIFAVFIQEAREQLSEMEQGLMRLQQGEGLDDPELINGIFRAAHTIKGSSGVVEIHAIEHFTHSAENALDQVRNGSLKLDAELIDDLLAAADHLGALLDAIEQGESVEEESLTLRGQKIVERLKLRLSEESTAAVVTAPEPEADVLEGAAGDSVVADTWHISLRFGHDVLRHGQEPLAFLRYLISLGEIAHITTLFDDMPEAQDMDAESCYLGFEINFRSDADKAGIERVFEFVRDECDLRILPPNSKLADYIKLIEELPEESHLIGEILVQSGALTQEELDRGLRRQQSVKEAAIEVGKPEPEPEPIGSILVDQKVIQPEVVEAAAIKQKQVSEKKAAEARLIRVQADKLDQLIDLVGELVIAGAGANLIAQKSGQTSLVEATSVVTRLVESIRDSALQLRMVQIGDTFNRFHRVVRDVSRELHKDMQLVVSGGDTELDKSVVEKIGDPLMHLVRNAVDHGIEAADIRRAAGKPAQGRVELNAYHDSGSIVIEVADDGGGLPKEKILNKAIERGIVQPGDSLSDEEVINLIFQPGFSTMDQVSNLSGRGVGMDVVRKNIEALRGRVDVQSEPGQGSRFAIRLPLTLAIIDGFLVSAGEDAYVIPLDMVVECLELNADSADRDYLNLRGEVLPFIRLRTLFEIEGAIPKRESVVVVRSAHQKAGIVVDHLLGEFQTVIKPLGSLFRHLRGISGSTILGSGDVALILDVPALTTLAGRLENETFSTSAANH